MLWEHEVVGSNPTAPTNVREPICAARVVVASAASRSAQLAPRTVTVTVWTLLLPMPP